MRGRVGGKGSRYRVGPVSCLSSGLPCAPEYAAKGISLGWRLVELTVAICCPLGQGRGLRVQRQTWTDTLL